MIERRRGGTPALQEGGCLLRMREQVEQPLQQLAQRADGLGLSQRPLGQQL